MQKACVRLKESPIIHGESSGQQIGRQNAGDDPSARTSRLRLNCTAGDIESYQHCGTWRRAVSAPHRTRFEFAHFGALLPERRRDRLGHWGLTVPGFERDGEACRAHRGEEWAILSRAARGGRVWGATWVFLENVPDICASRLNLVVGALKEKGFRLSVAGSLGQLGP